MDPPDPPRPRLLLVEDDAASRTALRVIFTRLGLKVLEASDLADAWRFLSDRPDYLVLDLMLPDGDGVKLLEEVRDLGLTTKIAVTTGSVDRSRIESVRSLNPDVLPFKPITLDQLISGLNICADQLPAGTPKRP